MLCEKCRSEVLIGMKTCFLVGPVGEPDSDTRIHADKLLEDVVRPACAAFGMATARADSLFCRKAITDTIIEKLESSDMVIADVTGNNANVFFEVGYRMALGLPMILISSSLSALPFDIKVMPVVQYDMSTVFKRKESVEAIKRRFEGYASGEIKADRVMRESDMGELSYEEAMSILRSDDLPASS